MPHIVPVRTGRINGTEQNRVSSYRISLTKDLIHRLQWTREDELTITELDGKIIIEKSSSPTKKE